LVFLFGGCWFVFCAQTFFLAVFWGLFLVWVGFWVCLVEVVVVEAFFQHGCSTKTIGCGSFYVACGTLEDFFKAKIIYARGITARNSSGSISTIQVNVEQRFLMPTSMKACVIKFVLKNKWRKIKD
jgi:hypothetical protein